MLRNEEFALGCRAWYEEQGLVVDKNNGQFAHSPFTKKECDTGYYLLWGHHQHQGLLQSRDLNKVCFFVGHAKKWLLECDYFPESYFDLWDIYDEFSNKAGSHLNEPELRARTAEACRDPEVLKRRSETFKANGNTCLHMQDPGVRRRARESMLEFWDSEEGLKKREIIKSRRAPRARCVAVRFPEGRTEEYNTVRLASLALGVSCESIRRLAKGTISPRGKLKGHKGWYTD
jgi:hypothetical protein